MRKVLIFSALYSDTINYHRKSLFRDSSGTKVSAIVAAFVVGGMASLDPDHVSHQNTAEATRAWDG